MTLLPQCLLGSLLLFTLLLTWRPHRALSPKHAVEFSHCHLESHPSFSKVHPFPEPVCKSQRLGHPRKDLQPSLLPPSPTLHFLNLMGPRTCPCTPGSSGAALRPGSKWWLTGLGLAVFLVKLCQERLNGEDLNRDGCTPPKAMSTHDQSRPQASLVKNTRGAAWLDWQANFPAMAGSLGLRLGAGQPALWFLSLFKHFADSRDQGRDSVQRLWID